MSEIEKMYLLAGIRKGRMSDEDCAEDCLDYECKNCRYSNYPQFTAEKQIKLICFLLNANIKTDIYKEPNIKIGIYDIAEAFAKVTNTIWQDLTEEEKQQIKEILE